MKKNHKITKFLWPVLLVFSDFFFIFLVWIANQRALPYMTAVILLFTMLVMIAGVVGERRNTRIQIEALEQYLLCQDERSESELLSMTDSSWHPSIQSLSRLLGEQSAAITDAHIQLKNYQDFIEEWTHEIKTPLSLSALLLDNHKNEMSPYVYQRMQHVQHTVYSDVNRILYYARLQADHVDYQFETIYLPDCIEECLREFQEIAEEKQVLIQLRLPPLWIVCDKKVFLFMLSQLLNNAFQYTAASEGIVRITGWNDDQENGMIHLMIQDNGDGVPPEDLPFIFDKGFTGSRPDRQHATGMGLYLVKKYAEQMSVQVTVESESSCGNGFGIQMDFPKVK